MIITLNKIDKEIPFGMTICELLQYLEVSKHVAVFVNDQSILLSDYGIFQLFDKDRVKIFKPLGGG